MLQCIAMYSNVSEYVAKHGTTRKNLIATERFLSAYTLCLFNVDFFSHSREMPHPYLKSEVLTKSTECINLFWQNTSACHAAAKKMKQLVNSPKLCLQTRYSPGFRKPDASLIQEEILVIMNSVRNCCWLQHSQMLQDWQGYHYALKLSLCTYIHK